MEYVKTFSFQAPHEKTKLAPSGQPVNTELPGEDKIAAKYFPASPVLSHQVGILTPADGTPRAIDEFEDILERARLANR